MYQEIKSENFTSQNNKKNKSFFSKSNFLIPLIIVASLVLTAGGVLAYKKLNKPNPEKIIQESLNKTLALKSTSFKNKITFTLNDNSAISDFGVKNSELEINGSLDTTNKDNVKNYLDITANLGDMGNIGLELIQIRELGGANSKYYIKLNSLPFIVSMFLDTETLDIKDKWINLTNFYNKEIQDLASEKIENIEKLKGEFWNNFLEKANIAEKIEIIEILDEEKLQKQEHYHYNYKISSQSLKEIIKAYLQTTQPPEWQNSLNKLETDEALNFNINILGEIWINKDTLYLSKITGNTQGLGENQYIEKGDFKALSFIIELFDINKEQSIKEPENSVDIETILENIGIQGFLQQEDASIYPAINNTQVLSMADGVTVHEDGIQISPILNDEAEDPNSSFWKNEENKEFFAQEMGIDPDLDSDNDGLTDFEETYLYFSDPLKVDTDEDGYSDKEEVDNNFNPSGPGKLK